MGGYSSKPIKYNITYDENGIMIVYTSDRVIKNKAVLSLNAKNVINTHNRYCVYDHYGLEYFIEENNVDCEKY